MTKNALLKIVDSYHDIFTVLTDELKGKTASLSRKNLVFLEEKVSLMAERMICSALGGTFNTRVYSFGKFLREKRPMDKVLSKEGSAMALKRIIYGLELKCFTQNKTQLASSLYDLLILLKSASLSIKDVENASYLTDGMLKNKLTDVAVIFNEYEKFLSHNGFVDQSTALSLLPEIIENDEDIKDADVYLVGYVGWTKQARDIVSSLLKSAKSVTAILPDGENRELFVGETVDMFKRLCREQGVGLAEEKVESSRCEEGKIIASTVFSPLTYKDLEIKTDKILFSDAPTMHEEIEQVAETIKASVMQKGIRYSDVAIAVPDINKYGEIIKTCFSGLDIPHFIDQEKSVLSHPLIRLIVSYYDVLRKNFDRTAFTSFVKNPLITKDKRFADAFENYLIKYNVNYDNLKQPFTFDGIDIEKANALREKAVCLLSCPNVKTMLESLNAKELLFEISNKLTKLGQKEEADVNAQIYDAVMDVLNQMDAILGNTPLSIKERKDIFLSGVDALKLSIIPQYVDAVFVGGYKEVALAQSRYTFMVGLTSSVPDVKEDVAILTDSELDRLESVKVLVEPKISIINKRAVECLGMALSQFKEKLFLSYPLSAGDGKATVKSEILPYLEKVFSVKKIKYNNDYLTAKQGLMSFAKECGRVLDGKSEKFDTLTAFYRAISESKDGSLGIDSSLPQMVLDFAGKELSPKKYLENGISAMASNVVSPTAIEGYYACPYKVFLSRTLRINEKENGEVSPISVGNIAHKIFECFIKNIEKDPDIDEDTAFNMAVETMLLNDEFSCYRKDAMENEIFERAVSESKIYCHKMYLMKHRSKFHTVGFESKFGDGGKYPAISLHNGKYKISGKIDRVDEYDDYFRVIDYKTGGFDVSESGLFSGTALQLYLYSAAVMGKDGKKPAGMYYFPVNEGFQTESNSVSDEDLTPKGKTLSDEDILTAQDDNFDKSGKAMGVKVSKGVLSGASSLDSIKAHVDYALKMCENATEQMANGFICQTPISGACKYCAFKGMCEMQDTHERTIYAVNDDVICDAINKKGDGEDD